jgi:VIT1/CCC1 family predicted Fe2+/Mn2+ transporter
MQGNLRGRWATPMTLRRPAIWLALNGALLMLVGLLVGAAIPLVPYPRLMLSAHNAGFTVSGTLSMLAAFLLSSSLCSIPRRAAIVVISGHVALWALSLSEVAAAFWGTSQALPLAAAEAGAQGGAQWQESIVTVCHVVPAIMLIVTWVILAWGVWRALKSVSMPPGGGSD